MARDDAMVKEEGASGSAVAIDRATCISAYSSADAETRTDELMQVFRGPEMAAIV
ncbi:hypothetical protein PF005_g32271 [Phytophthora fragariae]|uniref:Uncharacterized protein n=1 Tax=Phytophthora fragariae TaxID=53985 RepID=A0A6A3VDX2_9STRA|nr:hypothetical protein PF003_g16947 [Phytophthora fragariae]KAE8917709.1 hypothetical protein PF009_g31971 [Phytophthora fragariae]KAE8956517.1 hypothetical protein PF011_g31447 [Phytophthora fragariae]KAE9055692.1 hypothetical protein PF010_g32057 [Phytophthora fragariae]KAE9057026.1 hypothetical protein PF007_g31790 [Phytophthora fragariae]